MFPCLSPPFTAVLLRSPGLGPAPRAHEPPPSAPRGETPLKSPCTAVPPAPSGVYNKSFPRGAPMQHLAPRRNPERSNGRSLCYPFPENTARVVGFPYALYILYIAGLRNQFRGVVFQRRRSGNHGSVSGAGPRRTIKLAPHSRRAGPSCRRCDCSACLESPSLLSRISSLEAPLSSRLRDLVALNPFSFNAAARCR